MKKTKANMDKILEELENVPIIQVACEKSDISRNTFYKWRRTDKQFSKQVEESMRRGTEFVNDMSESQLLQLIKQQRFTAISFWLKHRHPKFKEKVEVKHKIDNGSLTPQQAETVQKALELGQLASSEINKTNTKNNVK